MGSDVALALQQDHERLDDMLKVAVVPVREHQWQENESLLENPRFVNIDLCDDAWINHYDVQCIRCSD